MCYDERMRVFALIILFILPIALFPQEQSSETVTDTSNPFLIKTTVVVTATKSEVEINESPVAASVVTSEELELRNTTFVDQALNILEGVIVSRGKGPADTLAGVGMRGFSGRGTGQSRVLVLLDGEPLNDGYTGILTWQTLPISEVERVEVARGPFSSLYGGNAMGGVINVLTKPVEKRHIEVSGRYGSQDMTMYSLNASDLFWNKLGLTVGYQRLQSGGYPSRMITKSASSGTTGTLVTGAIPTMTTSGSPSFIIGDGGDNWWNQHSFRTRGEYTFGPSTTVFFQYMRQSYGYGYDAYNSYLRDASGVPFDTGTALFNDGGSVRRFSSLTPKSFMSGPGEGTSNFYNGRLIHSFNSAHRLQVSGGVFDQPSNWYITPGSSATLVDGGGTLSERPSRSWHTDAQWSWEQSSRQSLLFGTEFRRESVTVGEYAIANYAIKDSIEEQTYSAEGTNVTYAMYGQDQLKLSERFQIIAGGRFDYWRTMDGSNNIFGTSLVNDYPDRSRTSLSGKLSALYQVSGSTTLYSSIGTAFRSPTVYNLYRTWQSSSGTVYSSNAEMEPEELFSWEVGLRQRAGSKVQFEATYYENRIRDLIYLQQDMSDTSGKTRIYNNAGKARTRGVELSARQQLLSWLQLRETYSFTDSVITENPAVPASVGKYVTYVPKHQTTGLLTASRGPFSGSLTARYASRTYGSDTNSDVTTGVPSSFDPYFDLSTSLEFRINQNVSITAGGENLLDRQYYQSYLAPGRTAFIGMRFSF